MHREKISQILQRGVENIVPGKEQLQALLESGKTLNIYLGIDPTATRIHLGHAVPLRKLQLFSELGHNVKFLIGDFTATIGDTSDKDTERPILTREQIEANFETYKEQASKVLDFSNIEVVFNSDWLKKLGFADLLQLTSQFSVNDFISRELIRRRLDEGKRVSLSEVLYPLMQGYDSYHMDTDIQLGGTDQIFNMQAGRTMIKNMRQKESFVIANGFLLGTDGRKMSKTWDNAIWLSDPAEEIFGKVMSIRDDLIVQYFLLATNSSDAEVEAVRQELESGINPMEIKKRLARQIVRELHGDSVLPAAEAHFVQAVQTKEAPDDVALVQVDGGLIDMEQLFGILVQERLVPSKSQGRRLLAQGALYLNEARLDADTTELELNSGENVLRVGKRQYLKLVAQI